MLTLTEYKRRPFKKLYIRLFLKMEGYLSKTSGTTKNDTTSGSGGGVAPSGKKST